MCGIVGYVGFGDTKEILLAGLERLEYRGYDSAGITIVTGDGMCTYKEAGKLGNLKQSLIVRKITEGTRIASSGIGHTRWATHGAPTRENAHPHADCSQDIAIVHNGIIENHAALRDYLEDRGHIFTSETDSEVIAHLVEEFKQNGASTETAFRKVLRMIKGAYALVLVDHNTPHVMYATRLSSPLVIGIGQGENYIASDATALVGHTREVIYLDDGQIAKISQDAVEVTNVHEEVVQPDVVRLEMNLEQAQKGDYPHFMLKEIFEGPEVLRATMRGRIGNKDALVKLGGLEQVDGQLAVTRRLLILACGTSYYAGLIAEYFFEEIAGIPTEVQLASEFRYRTEPFVAGTVALAISQSGETADTLAALRKAKDAGMLTLGVVNTVGSTIARETDAGVYNHAGPEIGVASTKAFLSQLVVLLMVAGYLAPESEKLAKLLEELAGIPEKVQDILSTCSDQIQRIAQKYAQYDNFLFVGRRYNHPVALEGALKLKEVSYIHAEGYGAGEMKHGPIALISEDFPTLAIVPNNSVTEKMISNIEEIKARGGPVIAITNQGGHDLDRLADDVVYIPETSEELEPLLTVIPLQLLAYYAGIERGYNVDKPRNLAKSVTVE